MRTSASFTTINLIFRAYYRTFTRYNIQIRPQVLHKTEKSKNSFFAAMMDNITSIAKNNFETIIAVTRIIMKVSCYYQSKVISEKIKAKEPHGSHVIGSSSL